MKRSHRIDGIEGLMLALVVAAAAAFVLSARVGATELPPRTGDRINLFAPPSVMTADAPFWVGHGWCTEETDEDPMLLALNPGSRVDFTIDGVAVVTGTDVEVGGTSSLGAPCVVEKISYYNARFGLPAGTHTIVGCWYLLSELQFCIEAEVLFEG